MSGPNDPFDSIAFIACHGYVHFCSPAVSGMCIPTQNLLKCNFTVFLTEKKINYFNSCLCEIYLLVGGGMFQGKNKILF